MDTSTESIKHPTEKGLEKSPSPNNQDAKMGHSDEEVTNSPDEVTKNPPSPMKRDTAMGYPMISNSVNTVSQAVEQKSLDDDGHHKISSTVNQANAMLTEMDEQALESYPDNSTDLQICAPISKPNPVTDPSEDFSEDSSEDSDHEDQTDECKMNDNPSGTTESSESSTGDDHDLDSAERSPDPVKQATSKKSIKRKTGRILPSSLSGQLKGLMTSSIMTTGTSNASEFGKSTPVSKERNKLKALREEVKKLPTEDQPQARKDASALIECSKIFDPSASIIDMNWKVKGISTLLKHHQLKAAAWVLGRERSETEPNGGLLCDEMGLGKTLTVLTIIAHEEIRALSKGPTLLIVPRSLVSQWVGQISIHCDKKIANNLLEFYPGVRPTKSDIADMQQKCIVLTTYEEICSSYPKLKPPVGIKTPEEGENWRRDAFDLKAGRFHKIQWHRIVADEAHVIKNKDSATSIAVRALKGNFKWAMSGTPLHNGVEELYPYLDFIYTSENMAFETFTRKYEYGLDEIVDTVLHRSTYSTRILGKPIVTLPEINKKVVKVKFCTAEIFLYGEMKDLCIAILNQLAGTEMQGKYILAMITYLRIFANHPLLPQRVIRFLLKDPVMQQLRLMAENDASNTTSGIISSLILSLKGNVTSRKGLKGDFAELREIHQKYIDDLQHRGDTEGLVLFKECPYCQKYVNETHAYVVTSCHHLYCKACFDELPNEEGKTNTATRICSRCKIPIEEAGYSDNQSQKRKQSGSKKAGTNSVRKRPRKSFSEQVLSKDESDHEWEEPCDDERDRISRITNGMPSAKITATRNLVKDWLDKDDEVKIVIFAQFLKTVNILGHVFEKKGWKFTTITGKVSPISRDERIESFGREKEIRIMISSLKTGGVGLNLTMANKCILIDPWWNEAIQEQAYCRLYRIGQTRPVEYVQLAVEKSVDTWMINLQKEKTWDIQKVLSNKEMLGLFGEVHEDRDGALTIQTNKQSRQARFYKQVIKSGIFDGDVSAEED